MTVQSVTCPESFKSKLWSPKLVGQGTLAFFGLWIVVVGPVINNVKGNVWVSPLLLIIFYSAIFGLAWWFGPRSAGLHLNSLGFFRIRWTRLALYTAGALILSWVFSGSFVIVCEYLNVEWLIPSEDLPLPYSSLVGLLILISVVPLAEEAFFRGFIYAGLTKSRGNLFGMMISSGMFAIIHVEISHLIPAFVSGLIFCGVYRYSGSIWPAVFAHGGHNTLAWIILT